MKVIVTFRAIDKDNYFGDDCDDFFVLINMTIMMTTMMSSSWWNYDDEEEDDGKDVTMKNDDVWSVNVDSWWWQSQTSFHAINLIEEQDTFPTSLSI